MNNAIIRRTLILVAIAIAALSIYIITSNPEQKKPLAGQGNMLADNVQIGSSFELIDQEGNSFKSSSLEGKLSLIYFGFTYCPDICPTSLQKLVKVLQTLDKYQIPVNPVFITIDPMRDTPAVLKEYLSHFHPKFIGLTSYDENKTKEVAEGFKVYYAKITSKDNEGARYLFDHSSFVYLMDKNGKYLKHFYLSTPPEEIVEFIRVNK